MTRTRGGSAKTKKRDAHSTRAAAARRTSTRVPRMPSESMPGPQWAASGTGRIARLDASRGVATKTSRIAGLDALRGVAIIAMVLYHLCFDLRYFGITHSDFEHDVRWLTARSLILGSFMLIAGISVVLARAGEDANRRWLLHVAKIGAAAMLVTAASVAIFPQSFIWFGVLHAIAVSLLLARPLVRRPALAAVIGIAVLAVGATFHHPAFDNRALGWIGFMTSKPITEDYVPLFPWTGVLLIGVALGNRLSRVHFEPLAPLSRAPAWLLRAGRHSLAIYLVHQPVLIGLVWMAARMLRV